MKGDKIGLDILKLAGAYIAFCIGSGYATGQEIMQFFSAFGWKSIGAVLISMALFMWLGATMMRDGRRLCLKTDTEVWRYYCGNVLCHVLNVFVTFFLFGCFSIMIGGAGAAIHQYFGLSNFFGRALMAVLCLGTVMLGLNKLVDIIGLIGPVIIVFSILIGIGAILQNPQGLARISEALQTVEVSASCSNWAFSGALYTGYMALLVIPFLLQLSQSAKSGKSAVWGGALGGFFLVLAILVMNLALLANIEGVYDQEIPTLVLAAELHPLLAGVFAIIVLLGIFSSAVPMLWMVCRKAGADGTKKYKLTCVIMVIAALILSMLPFTTLVGTIYPYTGYIGIVLMGCVFIRQITARKKKEIRTTVNEAS